MTLPAKAELVRGLGEEVPLTLALGLLGVPRSTWYYQKGRVSYAEKYEELKGPLLQIARVHTEYGYRRSSDELRERLERPINRKVVQRLHRLWELPLIRGTESPKPSGVRRAIEAAGGRANLVAALEAMAPLAVLYTDFTELVYAQGKAFLMPLVDHTSKVVLGWALGEEKNTGLALEAWGQAKGWLRRHRVPVKGIVLHHDRDPIFTGYGWTGRLLLRDHVRLSYALHGARDNPEMESFNSRFKSENRSLFAEANSLEELRAVVSRRMRYYNRVRRHSVLGNQAPEAWLRKNWHRGRRG